MPFGESAILDTAREVSDVLASAGLRAAVIGGVAAALHGHLRATLDVDVLVEGRLELVRDSLRTAGFTFDRTRREFRRGAIPVQLVTEAEAGPLPARLTTIDGVITVSLANLINMKLRSGLASVLRAQDLADVVALIRIRRLTSTFAARIDRPLRPEFRKLVRAVRAG